MGNNTESDRSVGETSMSLYSFFTGFVFFVQDTQLGMAYNNFKHCSSARLSIQQLSDMMPLAQ